MRLHRARLVLLVLLASALPETIVASTNPCPPSFINFVGAPSWSSVAARDSTLHSCFGGGYGNCPSGVVHSQRGAYDLTAGAILSMSDSWAYFSSGTTSIGTNDVYHVEGLPTGALTFTAELHVQSSIRGSTSNGSERFASSLVRLRLIEGANSAEFFSSGEALPGGGYNIVRDTTLTLSMTHGIGETFTLSIAAEAFAQFFAFGEIRGELRFIGLPSGYEVVSCQGFGGGPTPAARLSWGELKLRYR